jgi:hypothetical protein
MTERTISQMKGTCFASLKPVVVSQKTTLTQFNISFFSPVNLLDSYEDRYTYSFAFAATASSIVQIILNNDFSAVLGEEFREIQDKSPSYVIGKQMFHNIFHHHPSLQLRTKL